MDVTEARAVVALNNRFYEENAASFSATRGAPWHGWSRCLKVACAELGLGAGASAGEKRAASGMAERPSSVRVLDVACGNLRFERFLACELPGATCDCCAVDSCAALAGAGEGANAGEGADARVPAVRFRELDVLACLADAAEGAAKDAGADELARSLADRFGMPPCDLAVCFGFMHHVPVPAWRAAVVRTLALSVRPGGIVCVSFWRFLDDERLARKAQEAMEQAQGDHALARLVRAFGPGDRLLGWQDRAGSFRYCHGFSDGEVTDLAASVADRARPIARFRADGKSGQLNEYLVLRVL